MAALFTIYDTAATVLATTAHVIYHNSRGWSYVRGTYIHTALEIHKIMHTTSSTEVKVANTEWGILQAYYDEDNYN